jgi:hypothetical protein
MFMPVESVWNAGAADLPLLDLRLFPVSCPRCKIKKEQNQINCFALQPFHSAWRLPAPGGRPVTCVRKNVFHCSWFAPF